ncbi:MAG: hypothetical protein WCK89_11655 [bacterium]
MTKRFMTGTITCMALTALALPLRAATATQSANFSASNAGSLYNGSGSTNLVESGFFSADMQPFNAALGTLQSFTVKWEVSGLLSGTGGPEGGSASGNFTNPDGCYFMIAGGIHGGGGGGNGNGAGPGQSFEVIFPATGPIFSEQTFTVANAGVSYDPAILAAITGTSSFPVAFTSAANVSYGNVVNLAASVSGKVTFTYTYEPASGGTTVLLY